MPTKAIRTIIVTLIFAGSLFLCFSISRKIILKYRTQSKLQILPTVSMFKMDSSTFIFPSSSVNILVYFNSECEYCQYELSEIRKNINLFSDNSIVLLSSENIASIKKTSFDFELANVPNVYFVKINPGDVYKTMGTVSFPHIFIYGKDNKLIKEFKGKAKIEAILKYIP